MSPCCGKAKKEALKNIEYISSSKKDVFSDVIKLFSAMGARRNGTVDEAARMVDLYGKLYDEPMALNSISIQRSYNNLNNEYHRYLRGELAFNDKKYLENKDVYHEFDTNKIEMSHKITLVDGNRTFVYEVKPDGFYHLVKGGAAKGFKFKYNHSEMNDMFIRFGDEISFT